MEITFKVKIRAKIEFDSEVNMYIARVPALPGVCSQGETLSEAKKYVKDAVKSYLIVWHKRWKEITELKEFKE